MKLSLQLIFTVFFTYFKHVYTSGQIKFNLVNFSSDGTLESGGCCSRNGSQCVCKAYVHVCIGFGFEGRIYFRDCPIANHNSDVIAWNQLTRSYNTSIPFTRWPTSKVSLTVEVRHVDTKAIIVRSERFIQLSSLNNQTLHFEEAKPGRSVSFDVRVVCDKNYYGTECLRYCNENTPNSHHRCSSEGELLCKEGWSGPGCHIPLCAAGCRFGTCVSPGNCSCDLGWQGPSCDECVAREGCQNGYCKKPFECICEKNWGGEFCDRDLDYCYHHSPCENGGKCTSVGLQNFYYCNCTNGFSGTNCENKVKKDLCSERVCGRFGECILTNQSTNGYFCLCDKDHFGERCQYSSPTFDGQFPKRGITPVAVKDSCRLPNNNFILPGFSWTTNDCQFCRCSKSVLQCVKTDCKSTGCFCGKEQNMCGTTEICVGSFKEQCLKTPCRQNCDYCVAPSQKDRASNWHYCQEMRKKGARNLNSCATLFMELDLDVLHQGTTTEDVCYHLVYELELSETSTLIATLICDKFEENIVQIDFASPNPHGNATAVKNLLKGRLRTPLTKSRILRSILKTAEQDDSNRFIWDTNVPQPVSDEFVDSKTLISTNHILAIIIFFLVVIFVVILSMCLYNYSGWYFVKERCVPETNLKEVPQRIYYTKPILDQSKLRRHSGVTVDDRELAFLERSFCQKQNLYSVDCDLPSKEMEDNERNARLLRKLEECSSFSVEPILVNQYDYPSFKEAPCSKSSWRSCSAASSRRCSESFAGSRSIEV